MSKKPEEMAKEYCSTTGWLEDDYVWRETEAGFLAGYKAAKDEDQAKMQELKANWKFCCEDKARLLNELAVAERAKDQLADADKVMDTCEHILDMEKMVNVNSSNNSNRWISVKDRLPDVKKTSLSLRKESSCVLIVSYDNVYVAHLCEKWCDRTHFIFCACDCSCRGHDMEQDEWELDQVTHWQPLPAPPKEEK